MGIAICDKCEKKFEDSISYRGLKAEDKLKKHEFWCKGKRVVRDILIDWETL